MNSCAPFSSSSILPLSLPLSSALAQDRINIPLKPVSTAARSPSPPPSLLLCLLLPPIPPRHLLFFSSPSFPAPSFFFWCQCFVKGISFPTISTHQYGGGGLPLPSVRSSPCCTHAHTHAWRGGGYRCL